MAEIKTNHLRLHQQICGAVCMHLQAVLNKNKADGLKEREQKHAQNYV